MEGNMKKAIVYYSMSGNTEYVANYIASKVEDIDLIKIVPKKEYPSEGFSKFFWGGKSVVMKETPKLENYEFDSSKYDLIIFGTPVWARTFTPPIRSFIKENMENIKDKKFAVIISYMGGGADKTIGKLKDYLKINEFEAELILIDPKNNVTEENNKMLDEFCEKIKNI